MLLSIGMIVKNEEKYLRRCLEAMRPLFRELECELIIADTGSTDRTVEIARSFTENVFHFDWCDDFAAARNSTLEKAKGQWYMYIDADEIITDCSNILRFFKSGLHEKFSSASVNIESSNYEDLRNKGIITAIRLVKRTEDLRFVCPIHEHLNTVHDTCVNLKVPVCHYGYISENNEEWIKQKMNRNLKIMLEEEKRNPQDFRNTYNICQAYMMINNLEAALEYCEKGIKQAQEQKSFIEYLFYALKAQIYTSKREFSNVLITAEEYFGNKDILLAADLDLYIFRAGSYIFFNSPVQAIEAFEQYIALFDELKQGIHQTPDIYHHAVNYNNFASYRSFVIQLVDLCIQTEDIEKAVKYSKLLNVDSVQDDQALLTQKLDQDLKIMIRRSDFTDLPALYNRLDESDQAEYCKKIEEVYNTPSGGEIVKSFYEAEKIQQTFFVRLMRLRYLYSAGMMTAGDVETLLEESNEINAKFDDLVYLSLYSGASIDILSRQFDAFEFAEKPYVENLCSREWLDFSKGLARDRNDNTCRHLWIAALHERFLMSDAVDDVEKPDLFDAYVLHYKNYLQQILQESNWTEESALLLPKPLRKGLLCCLAIEYREKGQKTDFVRCLRSILRTEPKFSGLIQQLINMQSKDESRKTVMANDFDEYAKVIKNNIQALCEANEVQKALDILKAYEQLCPDDDDIEQLKARLVNI